MNDDELKEFGRMTLHGTPPFETVMGIYEAAMRLMDERDKALAEVERLKADVGG